MFSQKNVLQMFVSDTKADFIAAGSALSALTEGDIGLFSAATDTSVAATTVADGGYIATLKKGEVRKSTVFYAVVAIASLKDAVAEVAPVVTLAVPTPSASESEYYQLRVTIHGQDNGDEIKKGFTKSVAGENSTVVATRLAASLQASLDRDAHADISVSAAAGTLTITGLPLDYVPGKKKGGYPVFSVNLNNPVSKAMAGTIATPGSNGIGEGHYIHNLELFAQGNQDAVSRNEFRTAFPDNLISNPAKTYNVLSISLNSQGAVVGNSGANTAYAAVPTPLTIVCAFNSAGA